MPFKSRSKNKFRSDYIANHLPRVSGSFILGYLLFFNMTKKYKSFGKNTTEHETMLCFQPVGSKSQIISTYSSAMHKN